MTRTVCNSEYEGLFAEFHDVLHRSQSADVALFRDLAREFGSPVLELGCGSGRILAPLVEDGHEVVGVDSSEDMLHLCRERVGDRATLHREDMRRLRLEGRFRLILVVCNTLWHCLEDTDAMTVLRTAREHLAPGGRLVVDGSVPDVEALAAAGSEPERLEIQDGPLTYQSELTATVNPTTRIERDRIVLRKLRGGRAVAEAECEPCLRLYAPDEVRRLLEAAGLHILHEWGSTDRTPLTRESREMIFVASDAGRSAARP